MASNVRSLQQPLVRLGIETALLANGTNLIALIAYIIKKSTQVCRFKDECTKLVNLCIALSLSFSEHASDMQDLTSGQEFFKCLQEATRLLSQCTGQWTIRHIGWEVIFKGRIEGLQKDLERCQQVFNTDILINLKSSTSTTTTALSKVSTRLGDIQETISTNVDTRQEFISSVRDLEQELEINTQELRSMKLIDQPQYQIIPFGDERITRRSGSHALFDGHKVCFVKILSDIGRSPRLVKIYRRIGDISMVQRMYGVTTDQMGDKYALLEDLADYEPLGSYVQMNTEIETTLMQKLQFAYDLACTMSSLHESKILVKNISDKMVYVKSVENSLQPVVAGLQEARDLFEPSAHLSFDARYEAPEVGQTRTHSNMSDMWSLGVLLIQWFTGHSPELRDQGHTPSGDNTTNRMAKFPFSQFSSGGGPKQQALPLYTYILQDCLHLDPFMRPSSAEVAQKLLDSLMIEATKDVLQPRTLKGQNLDDVDAIIRKVKLGSEERYEIRRAAKKKQAEKRPQTWIEKGEYDRLQQMKAEEKPVILYALGTTVLWNLVEPDEISVAARDNTGIPENVIRAKISLEDLEKAHNLGFALATKELYHAHRILAEHYQTLMT